MVLFIRQVSAPYSNTDLTFVLNKRIFVVLPIICCEYLLRIYPQRMAGSPQQSSFKQRRCQANVSTLSSTHTKFHQSKGWKGNEEVRAIGTTRAYIGPQQTHPADLNEALKSPSFKTELPTFLLNEWKEQAYAHITHEHHYVCWPSWGMSIHFFV